MYAFRDMTLLVLTVLLNEVSRILHRNKGVSVAEMGSGPVLNMHDLLQHTYLRIMQITHCHKGF